MITKEKAVSIDYTVLNSDEASMILGMFFTLLGREIEALINKEFKESLAEDEVVTMKVMVELDKRKIQG